MYAQRKVCALNEVYNLSITSPKAIEYNKFLNSMINQISTFQRLIQNDTIFVNESSKFRKMILSDKLNFKKITYEQFVCLGNLDNSEATRERYNEYMYLHRYNFKNLPKDFVSWRLGTQYFLSKSSNYQELYENMCKIRVQIYNYSAPSSLISDKSSKEDRSNKRRRSTTTNSARKSKKYRLYIDEDLSSMSSLSSSSSSSSSTVSSESSSLWSIAGNRTSGKIDDATDLYNCKDTMRTNVSSRSSSDNNVKPKSTQHYNVDKYFSYNEMTKIIEAISEIKHAQLDDILYFDSANREKIKNTLEIKILDSWIKKLHPDTTVLANTNASTLLFHKALYLRQLKKEML